MKKVVDSIYIHKSNFSELYCNIPEEDIRPIQPIFTWAFDHDFPFEVVKYDLKKKMVSLIDAIGWKERYEPIVGDSVSYNTTTGVFKTRKGGFQVYHMKELFVSPDYRGFDLEDARERTRVLNSIKDFLENKSRAGSLKWWNDFLARHYLYTYMMEEGIPLF